MADLIDRQTIIEAIHSAIYPYFCGAEDGDALSDDEKLVLSVNKTICTAIKELPSAQPDVPDTNVGDMISRQSAINAIENTDCELPPYAWDELTDAIMRTPSANAVDVVRCKDCYHYDEESEMCSLNNSEFEPTDYCSYGSK